MKGGAEAAPGPTNHKEFLRQLKGLDVFGVLDVHGLELTAGDLCILGQTLPNLRGLRLFHCAFPLAALPAMRHRMPH